MTDIERRIAAARFAADWKSRGDEKQETGIFWMGLLQKVYGVEEPDKYISFELPVKLDHTSFIDGYIESTRVLIEQKSRDIDLKKGYKQSDGSMLTPYQQARRYAGYLPHDKNPRWIVVCNFQEFRIHDMNRPNDEPEILKLEDLEKEYHRLQFLVDTGKEHIKKEMEVSLQAGELVGVLYDALLKQYKNPGNPETLKSLNKLCVRLVFCLYAEDAGIFGGKSMFHDYLRDVPVSGVRRALVDLFKILDQKPEDRDKYLADDNPALAAFPYVNGGLFNDEDIEIPPFTEELKTLLLENASEDFDWSDISPTIFGAVFESTLNPETRRSGGMHYTSIENIHKLIDPLFLDGLKAEFAEIEAVTVAKTALWIAESQMMRETENVVRMSLDFLPLKSYANITEGNALRLGWSKTDYIMGNPPFVGHQWRTKEQTADLEYVCYDIPKCGKLDYVCGWYNKAADHMQGTNIHTAFVSTNSISQGESVGILWKPLFEKNVQIEFAHRTFVWTSEAKDRAAVHCVIVGFTCGSSFKRKRLFESDRSKEVSHINGYLVDAPDIFIQSRGKVLTKNMPEMSKGSQPTDGGNLIFSPTEKDELLSKYPVCQEFIRRYISADDYINNRYRYCLWLKGVSPSKYRHIPIIMNRLNSVAECRLKSPTASVRRDAETPMLFTQIRQPNSTYLAVPEVSSSRRRYIPFGYMDSSIIASNMLYLVPNVTFYMFGVMASNVHMAWMRAVGRRLKSDYRYTPAVYNNFPWPMPTDDQKAKIEQTAQAILDARALYPDSSLADLYDETTMPPELRKAHQQNDRAVMQAYGFSVKDMTESKCVAELMKMYQALVSK